MAAISKKTHPAKFPLADALEIIKDIPAGKLKPWPINASFPKLASKPTLAEVRKLVGQLALASRRKLLAELLAA